MSALLLVYPLLIIVAVRWDYPWLGSIALVGLGFQLLWPALQRRQGWAAWMMSIILMVATGIVVTGDSAALPQLLPVTIFLMLSLFFGRTLRSGSVPLVARIAGAARDIQPDRIMQDMEPRLWRYTWRVTCFWTLVFLALAIEDLVMLWLAPPMPWPFVVNLLNFSVILLLLLGEYLYHSRRYPNPKHNNFLDFARDVARFDYHKLLDD